MSFERHYNKYLVLKWEDIDTMLNDRMKENLWHIAASIEAFRHSQGKKVNTYVVVNEDEPYAEQVWELIENGLKQPEVR